MNFKDCFANKIDYLVNSMPVDSAAFSGQVVLNIHNDPITFANLLVGLNNFD